MGGAKEEWKVSSGWNGLEKIYVAEKEIYTKYELVMRSWVLRVCIEF